MESMTWDECVSLISTVGVGRVAFTDQALPQVLPVNFAVDGSSIVFRTSRDGRLAASCSGTVVAFEVDSIEADFHTGWSVLLIGAADAIVRESELIRARRLPFAPWPGGDRDHFVRIVVGIMSGRRLEPVSA